MAVKHAALSATASVAEVRAVFAGLATLDVIHRVERLPRSNEKVSAATTEVASGGPAANAAKTFAALGGESRLVTALGSSSAARLIRADLESWGVEVCDVAHQAEAVIASVLVEPSGDRAVVGAPADAAIGVLDAGALLVGADVLLLDGHHAPIARALAAEARGRGVPTVWDAGRPKPVWAELAPWTDVALCSADFRFPNADGDAVEGADAAAALFAVGLHQVAVTAGPGEVRWWEALGAAGSVTPPRVPVVDTLGAGDVLHGAYCFYAAQGRSFSEALAAACAVASDRCSHVGLGRWLASLPGAARWTP